MENNKHNDAENDAKSPKEKAQKIAEIFGRLAAKMLKLSEQEIIKEREIKELDKAVDAIKDMYSDGNLISYLVMGLSNDGTVGQGFIGSNFTALEMMSSIFQDFIKNNKNLGEDILERLKSDFNEEYPAEEEDDDED